MSRRVLATQASAVFAPTPGSQVGRLLFVREGMLVASLSTSENRNFLAAPIAGGFSNDGAESFSVSQTGTLEID